MADAVPIEVLHGSLEERILRFLLEAYPVTTAVLARDLRIPEARLGRVLKGLVTRGVVELEELPDKTFVRLLRQEKIGDWTSVLREVVARLNERR